jgi:hypothetical protein
MSTFGTGCTNTLDTTRPDTTTNTWNADTVGTCARQEKDARPSIKAIQQCILVHMGTTSVVI